MPSNYWCTKDITAARGGDEFESNLKGVTSDRHSTSPVKVEKERALDSKPSITAAGIAHEIEHDSLAKKRRVDSPSPVKEHNRTNVGSYGAFGLHPAFAYPAPRHQPAESVAAFPDPAASNQPHLPPEQQSGQVFPGQSPPFQLRSSCLVGMDNGAPVQMLSSYNHAAEIAHHQPIVATHISNSAAYATVPYPYHINYPTGQPLVQHPNGHFYPAIVNAVSSDQRDNFTDAIPLERIVDNPPNPPDSALGQPKKWIRWTEAEDVALKMAVKKYGEDRMDLISRRIFYNTRDLTQCRQRWKKALQPGLVKGNWTNEEDSIILEMVMASSMSNEGDDSQTKWSKIAKRLPGRLAEHVKARWVNHLDPEIRTGVWTNAELDLLKDLHKELGNKWAEIAKRIPGRSETQVKNKWYNAKTSLKRKAAREAAEQEEKRLLERVYNRRTARVGNDEDDRRTSTESTETVQSFIFKSE